MLLVCLYEFFTSKNQVSQGYKKGVWYDGKRYSLCSVFFSISQIISPKLQFLLTRKIVMVLIFCLKDEFWGDFDTEE